MGLVKSVINAFKDSDIPVRGVPESVKRHPEYDPFFMTNREYNILKKYHKGKVVDYEDTSTVLELQGVGYLTVKNSIYQGRLRDFALATSIGEGTYKRENTMRTPIKRVLNEIALLFI